LKILKKYGITPLVSLKYEIYGRYAMKRNKVKPDRIIQTTEEYFKDILSIPDLKNLGLTNIAITKAEKITINEIARCLPVDVKKQKSKQTRLLRFLDNQLPLDCMMFSWARFALDSICGKNDDTI
jgi:hypothetical protein